MFSSKNESKDLSDKDKKEIERIVNFIERGGEVSKWDGGDTLITFVRKILFDSLSLDQLAFEIVRTRGFELNKFKAVDASMIRILDADDPQYSQDFENIDTEVTFLNIAKCGINKLCTINLKRSMFCITRGSWVTV